MGLALGTSEDAAKMRIGRALEKLRLILARRGVATPAAVLAMAISTNAVHAAPSGLACSVAMAAASKGAIANDSTLTLIKTTLKLMAWTKAKTAIVAGVGLLLATGTTTVAVKEIEHHRKESVFDRFYGRHNMNFGLLDDAPPVLVIRPTKSPQPTWDIHGTGRNGIAKILGVGQPMPVLLADAYDISQYRVVAKAPLPSGGYDFISTVANQPTEALQNEIKTKFGLVGRRETRDTDVLVLRLKNRDAPDLRPSTSSRGSMIWTGNNIRATGQPMDFIVNVVEEQLKIPVVDKTGLTGNFDLKFKWRDSADGEALKQSLLDQLGLEVTPAVEPLEVLVVEKAT